MWWRFVTFCVLVSIVLFVVLSCIHGRPAIHLFFHRCCEEDIENDQVIFENFGNNFLRERLVGGDIVTVDNSSLVSDDDVQEVIKVIRNRMNVHDPRSRKTSEEVLTLNDSDYSSSDEVSDDKNNTKVNNDKSFDEISNPKSAEGVDNIQKSIMGSNQKDTTPESIPDTKRTEENTKIAKIDQKFEEKDSVFSEVTKIEIEEEFDVTISDFDLETDLNSGETTESAKTDNLTDKVSDFVDESREHTTESVKTKVVKVRH